MLVEREPELALIDDHLRRGRDGKGATLLFCGDPGIGKSELLLRAIDAATGTVLRARGVELEAQMPFVALRDLLWPLRESIDQLPPLQRRALLGALAIEDDGGVEPFAVSVGTLTLLSETGSAEPVVVVVDDLHWLDAASLAVLQFISRRIEHDAVTLLLAARVPPDGFETTGCTIRWVQGLSVTGVQDLVAGRGWAADPSALVQATGGNPLAITELLREGSWEMRAAGGVLTPIPVNEVIRTAFRERIARLSDHARLALLVAASTERADLATLVSAAQRLGADLAAFEEGENADVITLTAGRLSFRHPIMRSVVYSEARGPSRRAAHDALAETASVDGRADEEAWHRALATVLPNEAVAARLETAAAGYGRRSGHVSAAQALVRAADLTPEDDARARRLHDAAEAARRAGRGGWALELLNAATATTTSESLQAEIEFTRAITLSWSERATGGGRRFEALAVRIASDEPELAAVAYGYGAALSIVEGHITEATRQAALAVETASSGDVSAGAHEVALQAMGTSRLLAGDPAGADVLRQAASAMLERGELLGREYIALPLIWLEEYDLVRRLLAPRLQEVQQQGDLRALTATLDVQAVLRYRTGDWPGAHADAAESVRLAEESDQKVQLAYSLATLAIIEAAQGRQAARSLAQRSVELGSELGLAELAQYVDSALGLLDIGLGEPVAALGPLRRAAAYIDDAGQREPCVHQWMADLIDAAIVTREPALAVQMIERLAACAERPWAQAVAWRGRGMMASADGYGAAFAAALEWHERTSAPFEEARTRLWWGRRLRRDRQRVAARVQLSAALEAFDAMGAVPWSDATRRELTASGERLRRDDDARDELTPQEAQITSLLVGGASNRDIAGTMYLSPKTVEAHLSRIYRKYGVRSRQQLAARVLAE